MSWVDDLQPQPDEPPRQPTPAELRDARLCTHDDTVAVEVRSHLTGGVETVAHLCRRCLEQLPANWGCTACEWTDVDIRRLCDPYVVMIRTLTRPCQEHA